MSSIGDYGVIGDGRSAALVSREGSIDWLCWPRFDSPAIFGAILDPDVGGRWRIAPRAPFRVRRQYLDNSCALMTTFITPDAEVELIDFMSVWSEEDKRRMLVPEHQILRLVRGKVGEVDLEMVFAPRPDYGATVTSLRDAGAIGVRLEHGRQLFTLRGEFSEMRVQGPDVNARLRVKAGEVKAVSLDYDAEGPAVLCPLGSHALESLQRTNAWWNRWAARCRYQGRYQPQVVRSALTLKLLSYAPSGAIVAAPTTSLPEKIGGDLNWDYRFCWLRDAAMTARALLDLGYEEEAQAFVSWLLHSTRLTRPRLKILYDVMGGTPGKERTLNHLRGHRGSTPVRIRNAAADQLQLDPYGEVIESVAQLVRRGFALDRETRDMLLQFGSYVCESWRLPDQGIWEPRTAPAHHTHSRALCWVALDRLLELRTLGAMPPRRADLFERERQQLRRQIDDRAWNARLASFTDLLEGETVDASLLLLGWYGIVAPGDTRMRSTFRLIDQRLGAGRGLLFRTESSRPDGEGAFGICSFWAAEHLARGGGTFGEAERRFRQLLPHANDLGLFAEEMVPDTGDALGNFPQAFTHVGLLSAACALEERERRRVPEVGAAGAVGAVVAAAEAPR